MVCDGILSRATSFTWALRATDERRAAAESMFGSSHLQVTRMSMSRGWHNGALLVVLYAL